MRRSSRQRGGYISEMNGIACPLSTDQITHDAHRTDQREWAEEQRPQAHEKTRREPAADERAEQSRTPHRLVLIVSVDAQVTHVRHLRANLHDLAPIFERAFRSRLRLD